MPDYQQGKIYKIECNVTGKVYIGSTCEPTLARRLAGHVGGYKRYLNGTYNYVSSFDVIQNEDYCIVLLEKYPCNTKDDLYARERYWTNNIDCVNKIKGQGMYHEIGEKGYQKQYYNDNKEKIIEKSKEYYNDNKDKIIEKSKEYYNDNKDKIIERSKNYRQKNIEKLSTKYNYEKNKDKLKEKFKEKHNCTCGGKYTHIHKQQHIRSAKHQQYLKHKTIIDGLNMIKALDKYFNAI